MFFRKKVTIAERRKSERLQGQLPATQDTFPIEGMSQSGLLDLGNGTYSRAYELEDVAYEAVGEERQTDVLLGYSQALNRLSQRNHYQLVVMNQRIGQQAIERLLMPLKGDQQDVYREEINQLMQQKFSEADNDFQTKRYIVLTVEAKNEEAADRELNNLAVSFQQSFADNDVDLVMTEQDQVSWVAVLNQITNPSLEIPANQTLDVKDQIAPDYLKFDSTDFKLNEQLSRVFWIEDYPKTMEDKLIRDLLQLNIEMTISLHAQPYQLQVTKQRLKKVAMANTIDIRHQQKDNFKSGVSEDRISGYAGEVEEAVNDIKEAISDNGQKLFSGLITVMVHAQDKEELKSMKEAVQSVGSGNGVFFDMAYKYQEEGFVTTLPLGLNRMAEEPAHMRDMTTLNVATQVPFESVELQSDHGEFFGQNQISRGLITVNRKNKEELLSPSGIVIGSTGSGKSFATKYQIINTLLNHPEDRIVIVDPESEYLALGKEMGAEILDIATGTNNHLNILDLADQNKMDHNDQNIDLVKEKTNLLKTLLSNEINLTASERGIIDRVTELTYERFEKPTLRDWQDVLDEQPGAMAEELKLAMYPYTKGSSDIFAHQTNIDLSSRFLIFNTKNLDDNLKPFAMKVILDQIWKDVVASQNKRSTWLYFDEIQVNFQTDEDAKWFANLWARVRKYGAIPTGITQNITTLLARLEGQKLVSNTEFMILLRQKGPDLNALTKTMQYDEGAVALLNQYAGRQARKGTGVIQADNLLVPFENLIPKGTHLYHLLNTDVATDQ